MLHSFLARLRFKPSDDIDRRLQHLLVLRDAIHVEICLIDHDVVSVIESPARSPFIFFAHLEERWWPNLDETEEGLCERAQTFRRSMTGDPLWPRTAIVSHWGFIRALTGLRVPNGHLLRFDPHSGEASDLTASDMAEPRRT